MHSPRASGRPFTLAVAVVLLVSACTPAASTAPTTPTGTTGPATSEGPQGTAGIPSGGTLSIGWNGEIQWLDPAVGYDVTSWPAERLVFEGLLDYDDGTNLVPLLADGMPTESADGKSYTFKLHTGVSFVKSRKLWLAFGRFWTAAESMSVDPAVRLISTTGASPVTRTSCCTGEISSVSRRFTSWPTDRFRPSRTTVVKPGMLAVIRYGPSGSRIARNRPAVSVISIFSKFVAVFRIATFTPGRAALLGSTTVPEMTPVVA